jgi:virulence factor
MKVAVIGLGDIAAKGYLPLLATWPGLELLAHSRSESTVESHMQRYPFSRGTSSMEELIAWRPESAIVLTPSSTHFNVTQTLLRAGVDCYVEKPLTLSVEASRQLAALAEAEARILMIGFNRRFAPLHQKVKRLWADRPISFCMLEKHRPQPRHSSLVSNYTDDAIHQIDLLRYWCGEATGLGTLYRMQDEKVVGTISQLLLDGGGLAVIATSRLGGRWRERYQLHGGGASVYIDAFREVRWVDGDGVALYSAEDYGSWTSQLALRGFEGELEHFFGCVRSRQPPLTSGQDSVKTQELLDQLLELGRLAGEGV